MMKNIAIFGAGEVVKEVATTILRINPKQPTLNHIGLYDDGSEKTIKCQDWLKILHLILSNLKYQYL